MEAKEMIIKTLQDFGRLSTSRIAGIVGIDYYYALDLLEKLLSENKIEKEPETNSVYWKIKNA